MSFRIHSSPLPTIAAPCMIRVKHHQLPKDLALAKLEAELEEEYEDEEEVLAEAPAPAPAQVEVVQRAVPVQAVPLPSVIGAPAPAAVSQLPQPQSLDETFKLRRKRRV